MQTGLKLLFVGMIGSEIIVFVAAIDGHSAVVSCEGLALDWLEEGLLGSHMIDQLLIDSLGRGETLVPRTTEDVAARLAWVEVQMASIGVARVGSMRLLSHW